MERKQTPPVKISYRVLFPERKETYTRAEAARISYGGMLINTREKLEIGCLVEIALRVDPGKKEKLKLLGEVRWIKEGAGRDTWAAAVFYLLPTAGRMFELFRFVNREAIEDVYRSKVRTTKT
jgi:Tfp pilus assembly protein PilZ